MKYKKELNVSYTLGTTLTIELLQKRIEYVKKVYIHSSYNKNDSFYLLEELCNKNNIFIDYNDKIFNKLSDKENCFVIGEFYKYEMTLNHEKHIVLVNVSNMGNLGTIIRSAVGFGIQNIAIIKPSVDVFSPKVVRASMGSIFNINIEYFDTFDEYSERYKNKKKYPFMLQSSKKICEVSFEDDCALIFGNESSGLPIEYLNIGDSVIIPHSKTIDSLNLTIAVSVAIYEVQKKYYE